MEVLPDEDPEIDAIEFAVGTKDRATVQSIVDVLFTKTRSLVQQGRIGDRKFRFCLNRIASLRAYGNLELPEASELTELVLQMLISRPAETATFCNYLESAPLNENHLNEISRLLVSEPLAVYSWQNFHLWRLASQRDIRRSDLTRRAHEVLEGSGAIQTWAARLCT